MKKEDLDAMGISQNDDEKEDYEDDENEDYEDDEDENNKGSLFCIENLLVVIAIILIIIASIFVHEAFDYKNNYRNSEISSKNAYVGGDAYNYIINAGYFSGCLNFAGSLYIISSICIATKALKKKSN